MAIITKSVNKTRDLSVFQLFDILQEEYVVCELRVKIYPHEKHQNYWKETMERKKEKILDIAKRNSLMSIFDDRKIKETYNSKILFPIGYPRFLYKDANQQLIQEKWDLHNYYAVNADVMVMDETGKMLNGVIVKVNLNEKIADINIKDKGITTFELDTVTRIITL